MKKAILIIVCSCCLFLGLKTFIPKNIFDKKQISPLNSLLSEQLQDTINEQRIADSLARIEKKKQLILAKKEKHQKDSINKLIQLKKTNRKGLNYFFKQLSELENNQSKQVRVAFFGDSMEDADMIVMHLRHYLQKKFGGKGVGYVPITSVTASGRNSIKHRFSNTWNTVNFMKKGYGKFPFGLNGKSFFVGDSISENTASVTFQKGGAYRELPLINPILFYGKPIASNNNNTSCELTYLSNKRLLKLKPNYILNHKKLPNNLEKFTLKITDKKTTPFYGVSFASKNGVIVDNLSVRGNSGLPLIKLNSSLMQQFNKHFNYDLVILAYGTNVFSFKNEKYGWYKSRMKRNIKHIHKCFPNADVLVFSMGDRSTKIDGVMQTPPHLPNFINLQYQIARESNSGFYNLYEQMGGFNSMVNWVEIDKLANKDYTHFKSWGAKKIGLQFYQWLMKNYSETYTTKNAVK